MKHGCRFSPAGNARLPLNVARSPFVKSLKVSIGATALACAALLAPAAHAQTLQVLTAGSSAQFGPFAVAAYQLAKAGGATAYHYTAKTSNCSATSTTCYTSLKDNRSGGAPNEPGNLWVVWSTNGIWAYLSVDSTVGVRGFQSYPRASLALIAQASLPLSSTSNYLFWNDGSKDTALTTAVYNALSGKALTAANTDIRPEDALFATNRAITSLGYNDSTNPIKSYFSATVTNPVLFALSAGATDPISKETIPSNHAFVTIPVGAAPIIFLVNNSTLSAATNLKVTGTNNASALFSGTGNCAGNLLDGIASSTILSPILREPLSGTMNTTEFTDFVLSPSSSSYTETGSQETGINSNPANQLCGSTGHRDRAIGTGEEVNAVKESTTPAATNAVGYAFFSYESTGGVSSGTAADKYITLDSVDPIAKTYSNGTLPYCDGSAGYLNCPATPGTSFPNLRNGTYRSWSIYRIVTDTAANGSTTDQATAQTLATEAQALVNSQIPDFVPFGPACPLTARGASDPGLDVYREHFTPYGVTLPIAGPNDGPQQAAVKCSINNSTLPYLTLGGQGATNTESGGDVGGVIQGPFTTSKQPTVPGPTGSRD